MPKTREGEDGEEVEAKRSWFSSFLRGKGRGGGGGGEGEGRVPRQFQLSTNHSRLDVCHQFINLLFGMEDVGFVFDSQNWRFVVGTFFF